MNTVTLRWGGIYYEEGILDLGRASYMDKKRRRVRLGLVVVFRVDYTVGFRQKNFTKGCKKGRGEPRSESSHGKVNRRRGNMSSEFNTRVKEKGEGQFPK